MINAPTMYPSGVVVASMRTTPDLPTMRAQATSIGVDDDVAAAAIANIASGSAVGVVVSGKLASGKDTVAEHLAGVLAANGFATADLHQTSGPIREEYGQIIEIVADEATIGDAASALVEAMGIPEGAASHIAAGLFEVTRDPDNLPVPEDRTDLNRHMLVYHADHSRRAVDPQYWTRHFFKAVYRSIAEGRPALLTGCRYPNEIGPAQTLGLFTVRLAVSRPVQEDRLWGRDGLTPNPAALDDPNECALDDYVGFNLMVGNDDNITPTVITAHRHVADHVAALAS